MNRTHRTSCISSLADEISRLKKHRDDLNITLSSITAERDQVAGEIISLKAALKNIQATTEDF